MRPLWERNRHGPAHAVSVHDGRRSGADVARICDAALRVREKCPFLASDILQDFSPWYRMWIVICWQGGITAPAREPSATTWPGNLVRSRRWRRHCRITWQATRLWYQWPDVG